MMKNTYARTLDELARIVADTEGFFAEHNIDESLRMKVDLSLEELFVNMITYNTETVHEVMVEMAPIDGGIAVSLTDHGVDRFDPTLGGEVDINAPLDEREPGGLGLYLVLKMADSIHYEYHDRVSKITFTNRTDVGESGQHV